MYRCDYEILMDAWNLRLMKQENSGKVSQWQSFDPVLIWSRTSWYLILLHIAQPICEVMHALLLHSERCSAFHINKTMYWLHFPKTENKDESRYYSKRSSMYTSVSSSLSAAERCRRSGALNIAASKIYFCLRLQSSRQFKYKLHPSVDEALPRLGAPATDRANATLCLRVAWMYVGSV